MKEQFSLKCENVYFLECRTQLVGFTFDFKKFMKLVQQQNHEAGGWVCINIMMEEKAVSVKNEMQYDRVPEGKLP